MPRFRQFVRSIATLICLSLALISVASIGTHLLFAGDAWLPIAPEDLALTDNPASPGADAMILYREDTLDASQVVNRGDTDSEYVRTKIFTQAGTKYANVVIGYSSGQDLRDTLYEDERNEITIVGVQGRTIHADGSIVEFSGNVVDKVLESANGYKYKAATFSLPDVQPGSIIEYKYIKAGQPRWIHSEYWEVSQPVFTREAHFTYIPYLDYTGFAASFRYVGMPPGTPTPKCGVGNQQSCLMTVTNIPPIVDEPLMPPPATVRGYVEWYYKRLGDPTADTPEQFWNREGKKWEGDLEHFVNNKDVLNDEVAKTVNSADPPETKLRKLYARVQQIRNLDEESERTKREAGSESLEKNSNVKDLLKHGYGTAEDLNFLFIGLARATGFQAEIAYVAPRDKVFFSSTIKDREQLSASVVWVHAGTQDYFLDPGRRGCSFGLLPWPETATSGVRSDSRGGQMIRTPIPHGSDGLTTRHGDLQIDPDGTVHGTLQISYSGLEAITRRERALREDDAGRKRVLEDEIRALLPDGASFDLTNVSAWDANDQPLVVEGTLRIPTFADVVARRLLVPADFFRTPETSELASQQRFNPIYFQYPYEQMDDLTFHPPAGYKVEGLPKDQKTDLKVVLYEISCSQQDGAVEVKRHLALNGVLFPKESYGGLRAFFGGVKSTDAETVVLESDQSAQTH